MKVKYNRFSTIKKSDLRFTADHDNYDETFFDTISGKVPSIRRKYLDLEGALGYS